MKKIIRLTESELVSLVKRTIMEETTNNAEIKIWGCNLFPPNSEEREWCHCSTGRFQKLTKKVTEKVNYIKNLLKDETYSDIAQKNILNYDKNDPFFSKRGADFNNMITLALSDCAKCKGDKGTVTEFANDIKKTSIFIQKKDDKGEYTLLNKLNSNYSALAYLLTIHRRKKNLVGKTFDYIFNDFFENSENRAQKGLETPFVTFILNFLSGKNEEIEIMKEVFHTIQETTNVGLGTEKEAYIFLEGRFGFGNVINYAGDYSFVDLFGVDFLVKGIPGMGDRYIPVQVKTNLENLYGNNKVCYNLAIAKKKNSDWIMVLYNGNNKIKEL